MRRRRGQGAVELALMIPLLFALAFTVIEFAFYFGVISWDVYTVYAAARAVQVGESATEVGDLLLDGNVTQNASVSGDGGVGATLFQPWEVDLPFVEQLVSDLGFEVSATLGPEEALYEGQIYNKPDNNMN